MQLTGAKICSDKTITNTRSTPWRRTRIDTPCTTTTLLRRAPFLLQTRRRQTHQVIVNYAQSSINPPTQVSPTTSIIKRPCSAFLQRGGDTVGEVMTAGQVYSVTPETSVVDALAMIVEKKITGLPVVNGQEQVIGVVSDFDLLAVDLIGEEEPKNMFPPLDQTWEVFRNLQTAIAKSHGRTVEDVMTDEPIVVRPETNIHSAARLLLETKNRRLPVVDSQGVLIGMITRRDIITAAFAALRENPDLFSSDGFLLA